MMLRLILLLCLSAVLTNPIHAQENRELDSLVKVLKTLPHDESRLEVLMQITLSEIGNTEVCRDYNDKLLKEAEEQGNMLYLCEAYYTQVILAYNTYDAEALEAAAALLEPLARQEKLYDMLFRSWRCRIDFMILTQDYERNEKEARKMLAEAEAMENTSGIIEAYLCLANIYRITFRQAQAIDILEKARPLAISANKQGNIVNIYRTLLYLYEETANYKNWYRTLSRYEAYLNSSAQDSNQTPLSLLIVYTSYMSYYSTLSDWTAAEKYRLQAETLYSSITGPLYQFYYDSKSMAHYIRKEEYENALAKVENSIVLMKELKEGDEYHSQLQKKAELLCHIDRFGEALTLYKEVLGFKDSIQLATIDKQYEQLKKDFNTEQPLLEQAQLQQRLQFFTLIMLTTGLLLFIAVIFYLLRNRRFLQKAEREMRTMTRQMELAGEAKDHFLSNINTSIRTPLNTVVEGSLLLASHQIADAAERQQLSTTIRIMSNGLLIMINDILDLSRLEAGMMKFNMTNVEIISLIHNTTTTAERSNPGIGIGHDLPKNTLYMVQGDNNRMQQVFQNLLEKPAKNLDRIAITGHEEGKVLCICIEGTVLAQEDPSQEIIIRNEINRMLITHFGGTYEVRQAEENLCRICLTLPIGEVIRPE